MWDIRPATKDRGPSLHSALDRLALVLLHSWFRTDSDASAVSCLPVHAVASPCRICFQWPASGHPQRQWRLPQRASTLLRLWTLR